MDEETKKCKKSGNANNAASCGGFYGLGLIGAGVIGFLKALVWPAFLVYELMKFLKM